MVPSTDWFLYGFVRKEAAVTSQIEGVQATLPDVVTYEATDRAERFEDVQEVCNYVDALAYARAQLADPNGLPLSIRLLRDTHRVPPPPEAVPAALAALERWWHAESDLPPLVRAGLAHVQFETIHPFLDGNGRIGRLLIALLIEHWGLLDQPLLYLSVAFRRAQAEYYARLAAVRSDGDWEGWVAFFLECVQDAADDGVRVARELHALVGRHRSRILSHDRSTVAGASVARAPALQSGGDRSQGIRVARPDGTGSPQGNRVA